MTSARWYIESKHFRGAVQGAPLCVIDGGALGGVFPPFDELEADLTVVGFEPDPSAAGTETVAKALWSSSGTTEVHIAQNTGVSSVYPPNHELLRMFPDRIGVAGRRTERVAKLEAISIDDAVGQGLCPPPDFIKLDIHSAEYEALEGAAQALRRAAGVLVETWHSPVHAGQHLHGDVERLLNGHRFHLFDHCPAAAWRHTLDGEPSLRDRPRLIASESLFFRDFSAGPQPDSRTAMNAIALADLYGYPTYAVHLSRAFARSGVLDADFQAEVERNLLELSDKRGPDPAPSHLETDTQRLSQGPWR